MSELFICPLPDSLNDIPKAGCTVRFDQIQKLAFQRLQSGDPSFTPSSILLKATWDALLAADDDTKLVITPYITNLVIPQGTLLTEGGNDNTTLNGIPVARGYGFVGVTAQLKNVPADVALALRTLTPESTLNGGTNLWVYFFNRNGSVIGDLENSFVAGFKVYNLFISDVGSAGFQQDNIFDISFSMTGGWSDNFAMYTPTAFNPLNLFAPGNS